MEQINFEDTSSVECLWKFELVDASGNVVETRDWQKNTVLDDGLRTLASQALPFYGSHGGLYSYIAVGSGTTAPASNQTQLFGFLKSNTIDLANSSGTFIDDTYNYKPIVYTYAATFGMNEAVGNISEVGLSSSSSNASGSYFCRNLVRSGQTPTPITKDNAHLLRVFLRISINRMLNNCYVVSTVTPTPTTGTVSVTGCINNQWVIQSMVQSTNFNTNRYLPSTTMEIAASTGWVNVDITTGTANVSYSDIASPVTSTSVTGTVVASGYTEVYNGGALDGGWQNSDFDRVYYIDTRVVIPTTDLNINIRSLFIRGFFQQRALTGIAGVTGEGGMFLQFNPVLAKTASNKLAFNFRHYWGRK